MTVRWSTGDLPVRVVAAAGRSALGVRHGEAELQLGHPRGIHVRERLAEHEIRLHLPQQDSVVEVHEGLGIGSPGHVHLRRRILVRTPDLDIRLEFRQNVTAGHERVNPPEGREPHPDRHLGDLHEVTVAEPVRDVPDHEIRDPDLDGNGNTFSRRRPTVVQIEIHPHIVNEDVSVPPLGT